MIQTNVIAPLRQILQNCGSSLTATDFKALLDALGLIEKNINEGIDTFIPEAPRDGKKYVRTNGTWVPLDYTGIIAGSFNESYDEGFDK